MDDLNVYKMNVQLYIIKIFNISWIAGYLFMLTKNNILYRADY